MNEIVFKYQRFGDPTKMINRLLKNGAHFFVRRSSDCSEIIVGDTLFTFTTTRNFPRGKLFLFQMVKKDVLKWIAGRDNIDMPPEFEATRYNYDYDDSYGIIAGTDLNHAYWRIALQRGIIRQETYEKGLGGDCKALRLATLSVLGRPKTFVEYKDGERVDEHVSQATDIMLKQVFKYIRLVCFNMMHDLAVRLGDDFECWKTDCIYYRDTPENRKLVHDFFIKRSMDFKQLEDYADEPAAEKTIPDNE